MDIVLIFPQLIKSFNVIGAPVPIELAEVTFSGFPAPETLLLTVPIPQVGSNSVFYAITLAIIYCSVCNLGGKVPDEIPLISESVDSQMPF